MTETETSSQEPRRMTGAKPSPRHKLAAAKPHVPLTAPPPNYFPNSSVLPLLLMWGNDQYGDCVTAEECAAKLIWSMLNSGAAPLQITNQDAIAWANQHGFLNGATLTDVMDMMISQGITINGVHYTDGPYNSVDWTNPAVLQSAIATGPVKIGISASALPNTAGVKNGWYLFNTPKFTANDEDHCVSFVGYGTMADCFAYFGETIPSGMDPNAQAYVVFTWSTFGVVDASFDVNDVFEAWLRNPTTPQQPSPNPTPVPPVPPVPVPPPGPTPRTPVGFMDAFQVAFRRQRITIPAQTIWSTPSTSRTVGAIHWLGIMSDLEAIAMDVETKNSMQLEADVVKLLTDLGLPIPATAKVILTDVENINIFALATDAWAIYVAYSTGNIPALITAVEEVLSDLGVNIPIPSPTP